MLKKYPNLIKSSYEHLQPYIPGMNEDFLAKKYHLERVIKLASNENPLGCSSASKQQIQFHSNQCHRYPDSNALQLRNTLAEFYQFPMENIIIGAGADALIHALAQTFVRPEDQVIISEFAFASYEIATLANQGTVVRIADENFQQNLAGIQEAVNKKTRLIFMANPNNPTGSYFPLSTFKNFLETIPEHVLVILDQAYFEYVDTENRHNDWLDLLDAFSNLIILRTFSKAYGLAGLRIGYGFAGADIIELLNRIRSPFTISNLSLAAASAALKDQNFIELSKQHNRKAKIFLTQKLQHYGLSFIGEQGNFLTVDFTDKSQLVFETLLKQGIILRPLKNYRMDNFLRITLGKINELEQLNAALNQLL